MNDFEDYPRESKRDIAARMLFRLVRTTDHKSEAELAREAEATRRRMAVHDALFGLSGRTDDEIRRALRS